MKDQSAVVEAHQSPDESSSPIMETVWGTLKLLNHPDQKVQQQDSCARTIYVLSKPMITVGRQKVCDICYELPVISGRHCSFHFKKDPGNKISLKDISTNGTFVNGELVGKGKMRTLKFGDKIQFGKSTKVNQGTDRGKNIRVGVYQLCKPILPFVPLTAGVNVSSGKLGEDSFASILENESVATLCDSGEEFSFISSHFNYQIEKKNGSFVISSSRKGESVKFSRKRSVSDVRMRGTLGLDWASGEDNRLENTGNKSFLCGV